MALKSGGQFFSVLLLLIPGLHLSVEAPKPEARNQCSNDGLPLSVLCDTRGIEAIQNTKDVGASYLEVRQFVERNEPFVWRNCLQSPSLLWWNDDANLEEVAGDSVVRVRSANRVPRLSLEEIPTPFRRTGNDSMQYSHINVTIREFLRSYVDMTSERLLYAAQIDLSAMPTIRSHLPPTPSALLEAIGPPALHGSTTMYFGAGAPHTQLHYDSLENLVCVVSGGFKAFELYDPLTSAALLYVNQKKNGNISPIPLDRSELERDYPMAKYALPFHIRLEAGDCLYIPVYWFHAVETSWERTISLNWWRKPQEEKKETIGKLLCGHTHKKSGIKC